MCDHNRSSLVCRLAEVSRHRRVISSRLCRAALLRHVGGSKRAGCGDPMIFGRAGEEIAECRAANIPVEVVPGVSAAQGAAARLSVSLTHRAQARRLQYVTGHDRDGRLPADIDWLNRIACLKAEEDPAYHVEMAELDKVFDALGWK